MEQKKGVFPSIAKASAYEDANNPIDGLTISCSEDTLSAELRMNSIEVRGASVIGGPFSLGLSAIRRNGFFMWVHPQYFVSKIFLSENGMLFTMSYDFKFDEKYYEYFNTNSVKDGDMTLDDTLTVQNNISHCGRTSCVWDYIIKNKADDNLVNVQTFLVATDRANRQSTEIAQFFPEGMKFPKSDSPPRYNAPELPKSGPTYTSKRKIIPEYIDAYQHVNYKVYIWTTMESLHEAFNLGRFPKLRQRYDSFLDARISRFCIVYVGECRLGQVLDISAWESEDGTLCVNLMRDEKIINYTTITYH